MLTVERLARIEANTALAVAAAFSVRALDIFDEPSADDGGLDGTLMDIAQDAADAGNDLLPMFFDRTNLESVAWAKQYAGDLIQGVTDETQAAIGDIIAMAFKEGLAPRESATLIRDLIGLTQRDAGAVASLRSELQDDGAPVAEVGAQTADYAAQLLDDRAMTIARTETISAANQGQLELWDQAVQAGLLTGGEQKVWLTTDDDRSCEDCLAMDNEQVGLDEEFSSGDDAPPLHPNCRCAVGLAELPNA